MAETSGRIFWSIAADKAEMLAYQHKGSEMVFLGSIVCEPDELKIAAGGIIDLIEAAHKMTARNEASGK